MRGLLPPFFVLTTILKSFRSQFISNLSSSLYYSTTTHHLYSDLLRKSADTSNLLLGKAIHAYFIKAFAPNSLIIHNHILNMYIRCQHFMAAHQLFDEMPHRNVVSWSAIIAGFVQHGFPTEALSMFSLMHRDGTIFPNSFTLLSALHACSFSQDLTQAYQIYSLIIRLGFESNIFLVNSFLTTLIRNSQLVEALKVFDNCLNKDVVSWNAMMAGYLQHSYVQLPLFWFRMVHEQVKPDNFTFASVLTGLAALCELKIGIQVHGQLVKSGFGDEICVGNSLADMYIKNQRLAEGFKVFDEMPVKDVCTWTEMASGCLQCGEPRKAIEVIDEMMKAGVKPNKFTLATAFNACANLASLEKGMKVHTLRIKLGAEIDVCVDNALLDMYAKCGWMDGMLGVFRTMDDRTVVSWTTMIMGCAQNGQAGEAIQIFDEMVMKGIKPNYITYVCVLYACSLGGFIEKGWRYLSSMSKDHGISPGEDHYACMVNLLGRAGRMIEAEQLILSLPFQPGVRIWQTLLAACHHHGDVEIGKRAAERAISLNGKDSSSYVLLSNMLAGLNNWDSVGMLRQIMETKEVKKMPGSSWIELERTTH